MTKKKLSVWQGLLLHIGIFLLISILFYSLSYAMPKPELFAIIFLIAHTLTKEITEEWKQ